jgi:redox-sensitive bicupin YhaK (pirin superfamily)
MSVLPHSEPECRKDVDSTVELTIEARTRDLGGGLTVRRLLPSSAKQMVGPFIFFDHMGPVRMKPGQGIDVRPHPHINLATVTYLFAGASSSIETHWDQSSPFAPARLTG